jgi:hypothetical protein
MVASIVRQACHQERPIGRVAASPPQRRLVSRRHLRFVSDSCQFFGATGLKARTESVGRRLRLSDGDFRFDYRR